MKESRFYICRKCGNLVGMINSSGVPMMCCGEKMQELVPNTVEASAEKHLPVAAVEGDNVKVCIGSAAHPMTSEHHIAWVYLQTESGGQRKNLDADGAPEVVFALCGEKPVAVYAYCNLHGLWKSEI
ncbi:MAG: desulfoferrodoxin [Clostridiales bacterium]|nr:desulfoferrodoxin [Clostridiales bacterium]